MAKLPGQQAASVESEQPRHNDDDPGAKYLSKVARSFPAFFLLTLALCLVSEWGPSEMKKTLGDAVVEPIGTNSITLLFIGIVALAGLAVLTLGALDNDSGAAKRWIFELAVTRPMAFLSETTAPIFGVIGGAIAACLILGYHRHIGGLLAGLLFVACFGTLCVSLEALTRKRFVEKWIGKLNARWVGGFFIFCAIMFVWLLYFPPMWFAALSP